MDARTLRFAVVGVLNTAVGVSVIFAAKGIFGLGDLLANAIGYGVGLGCGFVLYRSWTFQHKGHPIKAAGRFIAAVAIAYALNLATVFGLRDLGNVNAYLAQAAGVIPYTVFLYLASKVYVFPGHERHSA
jgi:putative flippase GtrA